MKQIGIVRLFGIIAVVGLIGMANLPAATNTAHAQDSSVRDASAGDEGPGDTTSPDPGSSSSRVRVVSASGHWSGTLSDNSLGAGSIDLLISQSKRKLGGGFDVSGFQGTAEDLSGALTGKASPAGIAFTLKPTRIRGCRISGVSSSFDSSEIKGSYTTQTCGSSLTAGVFDVRFEHP